MKNRGPIHLGVRLQARLERAQQEGLGVTLVALVNLAVAIATWVICLPIAMVLHASGFRRLAVIGGKIGHLSAEVDCFLKKNALGEIRPDRRYFLAIPSDKVANRHLLDYWRNHIPVVSNPLAARLIESMSRWFFMREDIAHYILHLDESQEAYRVNASWSGRPPILHLTEEDVEWGDRTLRELGIPEGAWFVCVHVREPGFSPGDEPVHAHRNARVDAVIPAMKEIARRGGWCVRMGDPSMKPMPACENVIDYAHHRLRSARMDVVLCARCRFFLGNTSGLAFVSAAFGVPSALANMIPLSALGILPVDLSIPKLLWLEREARYLGLDEIMSSDVANYRYAALYEKAGIRVEENSPEDIRALAAEMLDRLGGRFIDSEHDRDMRHRFEGLLKPGHYSYGTAAHMATSFLRRHEALLGAAADT